MIKLKILPRSIYTRHILEYSEYSKTKNWACWYSKVAPLKGKRIVNTLLEYKSRDSKVLDLGCGIGLSLSFIGQVFKNSIGCDISENSVKATKEILKKHKIKTPVILCKKDKLPFRDNYFDIVTFIEVIEHVENPDAVLKEIRRVLKPDGVLHITTANKWWPIEPHFKLPFLSYLPRNLADFYVKTFNKDDSYQKIHLPSYTEFYKIVNRYFWVEDVTLEIIRNYKKYGLRKERGGLVILIGGVLRVAENFKGIILLEDILRLIRWLLIRISLGWLFIARPRKNGNKKR